MNAGDREMIGKRGRWKRGWNHGIEKSRRKLERSHRWWVRWTRLFSSRGGLTLISARRSIVPLSPFSRSSFRIWDYVESETTVNRANVVETTLGEKHKKEQRQILVLEGVPSAKYGIHLSEMRIETGDGLLFATFHLTEEFF